MIKKTKSGFPKQAFRILNWNYNVISSPRPCEKCGEVSILRDMIDDKFVCYACWKKDYDKSIKNNEEFVKEWEKRRDKILNETTHMN
jgi:hypothetical protein